MQSRVRIPDTLFIHLEKKIWIIVTRLLDKKKLKYHRLIVFVVLTCTFRFLHLVNLDEESSTSVLCDK